jgi:hypothetical protein
MYGCRMLKLGRVLAATHAGGERAGCQAVGAEIPPAQADCGGAHLDDFGAAQGLVAWLPIWGRGGGSSVRASRGS